MILRSRDHESSFSLARHSFSQLSPSIHLRFLPIDLLSLSLSLLLSLSSFQKFFHFLPLHPLWSVSISSAFFHLVTSSSSSPSSPSSSVSINETPLKSSSSFFFLLSVHHLKLLSGVKKNSQPLSLSLSFSLLSLFLSLSLSLYPIHEEWIGIDFDSLIHGQCVRSSKNSVSSPSLSLSL